jgi:hypothetical protein
LTAPVQLNDYNFFVAGTAHCLLLDACGKLVGHHLLPINPATINDLKESSCEMGSIIRLHDSGFMCVAGIGSGQSLQAAGRW